MLGDIRDQPVRIVEDVVAQRQHRALGPDFDALDIGAPAQRFDRHHLEEIIDLLRQRAETVDELGGECLDGAIVLDLGQAAIEREPHRQIGDVVFGDQHRRADGDLRRPAIGRRRGDAGLHLHHRFFQHLLI